MPTQAGTRLPEHTRSARDRQVRNDVQLVAGADAVSANAQDHGDPAAAKRLAQLEVEPHLFALVAFAPRRLAHIAANAERALSGPRQDKDTDSRIIGDLGKRVAQLVQRRRAQGIQALRTVDDNGGSAAIDAQDDVLKLPDGGFPSAAGRRRYDPRLLRRLGLALAGLGLGGRHGVRLRHSLTDSPSVLRQSAQSALS